MRLFMPTDDQVQEVALNLRGSDWNEVTNSGYDSGLVAVWSSWRASSVRHGIEGDDGQIVGVCGVCKDGPAGEIWMLGTDGLMATASHRRQFVRLSQQWIDELLLDWRVLHNWVFAANRKSVAWLRFLDFTVYPAEPHGPYAQLFRYFCREVN